MKKIDLMSAAFSAQFANAPLYVKTAVVSAVQLTEEGLQSGAYSALDVRYDEKEKAYVVDTYVMEETEEGRKAKLENTRPVEPGMWVVTNPVQQEGDVLNNFAMDDVTFRKRYEPEGDGRYRAKGRGWIIPNDTGEEVEITPPWGGTQTGAADCFFVCAQDPANPEERGNNRYILSQNDFAAYGLASEVLG